MEEERKYCVYMHQNKINGKKYIGLTSQNIFYRFREDGNGYKHCSYFYNAIQKYGWNNFEHKVLLENLSKKEACEKEKYFIKLYSSNKSDYGYNLTSGGDGVCGYKHTIEERKKISKIAKDRFENNPSANLNASKIYCNGIVFGSLLECAKHYNLKESVLRNYLNGKTVCPKYLINFGIKYVDKETKIKYSKNYYTGKNSRRVKCIETNEIFDCILDAAKDKNLFSGNITRVCQGNQITTGGFHWEYIDEEGET